MTLNLDQGGKHEAIQFLRGIGGGIDEEESNLPDPQLEQV
jgi:hypothetical protein